jgi:coenzyme F420-reducing hydrogenase delta subunit/Pyruvate/2-oxoacid:ferredoxin oxidoreductase delta subunit
MIPREEFKKNPRVLILGKGLTATETAAHLVSLGYEVVISDLSDQRQFLRIEGFAGDFQVQFKSGQKSWTEAVGAIVVVPELVAEPNRKSTHLSASDQVIGLDDLAALFPPSPLHFGREEPVPTGRPSPARPPFHSSFYVAFGVGLDDQGNPAEMAKVLWLALKIRQEYGSPVYIFCRNVKVAEEGMERLYQACRDEGVIFFKFDQSGPEIIWVEGLVGLEFDDAVLGQSFAFTPDLLVVDARQVLPRDIREMAVSAQIGMDESGYLQPANVHLHPQASQREGIFIAGPGKGPMVPQACLEEARAAALSVHHFFEGRTSEPMDREVAVDKGLCTICLTCLRYCPHQAIGFSHRVFIHPLACRRCGICAGECPMDAIQMVGFSDREVDIQLAALQEKWGQEALGQPRVLIFGCQRSAGKAWEEVQGAGFKVQGEVEFMALPCAGKLDIDYLLKALTLGADGVLVLACPEENCRSLHGNTYARERIREARYYLEEVGLNSEKIRFEPITSNQAWVLKAIIEQFMDALNEGKIPKAEI